MQANLNTADLSPMMRQYAEIKNRHPDEILFYRLGDFYEMFFDDAIIASRELELVLTGRECGLAERAPMCGVPHHSSEIYIARLIKKGFKVAVCEQTEDPAAAKGIVRRAVVRVVTPGTVTDASMLREEQNNYICGLFVSEYFGLCFADVTTGSVELTEAVYDLETIRGELARFAPAEVVMNAAAYLNKELLAFVEKQIGAVAEQLYDGYFQMDTAKNSIVSRFPEEETRPLHRMREGAAARALGALVKYIGETQPNAVERLVKINPYRCSQYLSVSVESRRNLELTETIRGKERRGSLLWVIDKTATPMGRRLLRNWLEKPLTDPLPINRRLDAVTEISGNPVALSEMREGLSGICDIERVMTRVLCGSCTPRDLLALADTAKKLAALRELTRTFSEGLLLDCHEMIDPLEDIGESIRKALVDEPPAQLKDGGYIRGGFHPEVDEQRELLHNGRNVLARMEQQLRAETGIRALKIGYNKVFGYYIEVSRAAADTVPDTFLRKQTLANGERYITEELKTLENRILGANERLSALERELFEQLRAGIESNLRRVQRSADAVAALDLLCCFALLGSENHYVRPVVDNSGVIRIKNGRHPVLEQIHAAELFVPNDSLLDTGQNLVNIITGPNMAGKSTYMRQTALIVILAQMGCFVPAKEASIGVVDAIFTRIGASDDLFGGSSTFMVEMKEVAQIFRNATSRSLIILDEVGRGTSTYDGMSIARAVIESIAGKDGLRAKTMFATHYHELTVLDGIYDCVKNYNVAAKKKGGEVVFLRRIVHGPSDDSYGIEVARLAGIPGGVIARAEKILAELETKEGYVRTRRVDEGGRGETEEAVLERLRNLNIEAMTPMEAMVTLHEYAAALQKEEAEHGD